MDKKLVLVLVLIAILLVFVAVTVSIFDSSSNVKTPQNIINKGSDSSSGQVGVTVAPVTAEG